MLQASVLALVAGLAAPAQEKAAPPAAAASPAEDSIASAKREFELLKAARDGTLQQKGELPRIGVPDFHQGVPAPSLRAPNSSQSTLPPAKSAHWLVDAMEKKSNSGQFRDHRGRERDWERASTDFSLTSEKESSPEATKSSLARDVSRDDELRAAKAPVNPLARYLGDWMTPHDYALLKPGLDASLATGGDARIGPGAGALAPGLPAGGVGAEDVLGFGGGGAPVLPAPSPRENPFREGLNLPAATPTSMPPPRVVAPMPSPAPPASIPSASPVQMPPPKSRTPDFAQPGNDDKYYKQLKRF